MDSSLGSFSKGRGFESSSRTNSYFDKQMRKTVESKVAETVLQRPGEIIVRDMVFRVAPPSVATLILASEAISKLPDIRLNGENIASESLYVAKDCRVIGEVVAILMLGAKGLQETRSVVEKSLLGLKKAEHEVTIDHKAELTKKLLEDLEPRELHEVLAKLLGTLQIGDFFGLTASLIEINLLRQTREAETTASGR